MLSVLSVVLCFALLLVQPTVQCKHVEFSDNEELAVYLFNEGDASVTPDVVVQYHEWSLPSLTLHFIQLAHFGKILAFSYAFVKYIFLCIVC